MTIAQLGVLVTVGLIFLLLGGALLENMIHLHPRPHRKRLLMPETATRVPSNRYDGFDGRREVISYTRRCSYPGCTHAREYIS